MHQTVLLVINNKFVNKNYIYLKLYITIYHITFVSEKHVVNSKLSLLLNSYTITMSVIIGFLFPSNEYVKVILPLNKCNFLYAPLIP